ncbi:MAG: gamma-glutamyltransferase family protein [Acidimicrobiia bacterium]
MNRPPEARLSTGKTQSDVGIVVSPHFLASQAGVDILNSGGNAVDAAIAVDAVLSVVLPDTCGPGGDLFALVHQPGDIKPTALNASGRCGSGVTADELRDRGLGEVPYRSPWSISVPGCVDGWFALSQRHGALDLSTVFEAAVGIATAGFPVGYELASSLNRLAPMLRDQPSADELYPNGTPPEVGSVVTRPRFGRTLQSIASSGRDAFYTGQVAAGIQKASEGLITPDDLAHNQAEWIEPLGASLFGRTAWTIPPNSQGYLTLATLRIFEMLNPPTDPNDPLFTHLLIEAYRSVAWEREDTVGDPNSANVSTDKLLSEERLAERAAQVSREATNRWPVPSRLPGGTAYMTVLDGSGMGISFIQSNFAGIGSGLSAGDTGVWLHNRGAGFNLIQGHPNEFAAGKRPLHTLSPTLWTHGQDLDLLLGTRGGDQQPQYLAQFAAAHYHAGLCTDDAQSLPRWNMTQPRPGTDSQLRIEGRYAPSVRPTLERLGHDVSLAQSYEPGWGPISAIDASADRKGSADPRVTTSAAIST